MDISYQQGSTLILTLFVLAMVGLFISELALQNQVIWQWYHRALASEQDKKALIFDKNKILVQERSDACYIDTVNEKTLPCHYHKTHYGLLRLRQFGCYENFLLILQRSQREMISSIKALRYRDPACLQLMSQRQWQTLATFIR